MHPALRYSYYLSSTQGVYTKKDNLLVFITPAQSNSGTTDDGTSQPTGRVPYADMPARLQSAPANVDFVKQTGSTLSIADMEVLNTNQWGWLNQFIYVIAPVWDDIIYCKKSLGGSTLLSGGLGDYPRNDFKLRAADAIEEADSRWGEGNYNVVYIAGIGETNSLSAANADDWLPAMQEYIDDDLRVNYADGPIVVIKKGKYQVIDFPYIVSNLWPAQDAYVALDTRKNFIAEGSDAAWELLDQSDDFSHYNAPGAISMGNAVAEKVLEIFNTTKSDATKPTISSAVVENAAPSNIVVTFSKNLDAAMPPFWKDFTLNGNRIVKSISISGAVLTLTVSEPYYTGQTIQLSYTKKQYLESCLADAYGNEVDNFSAQAVTNNVATAVPTYSNRYTSNFSAGVDGWFGFSGGGVAAVDGIGGQDDVLRLFADTDNSPVWIHNAVFTGTIGHTYRHRFDMFIPSDVLIGASTSNDYSITITNSSGGVLQSNLYPYVRRNVLGGTWFSFETVYTLGTTGTSVRYESPVFDIGEEFYLKNIVIDRIV